MWAVREDGALLAFTTVKDEDVFAWTPCYTRGKFVDVVCVREGNEDRIYVTTQRLINDRWTKFFERMDLRNFTNVEDAWCVDAGLALGGTAPIGELTIFQGPEEGRWEAYRNAGTFVGTVGQFLRAANGVFKVTGLAEPAKAQLELYEPPTNFIPESGDRRTFPIPEGEWTLDSPVNSVSGLWHLEGETVSVLGDGNVLSEETVVNGSITLSQNVTRAIIGLGYTCRAKTLPVIVNDAAIESRRKRIVGVAVRLSNSRGLEKGPELDRLFPFHERTDESYGHPTRMINGIKYELLASDWTTEGQTYFVQSDPLPATILSVVLDIEVGDDPD